MSKKDKLEKNEFVQKRLKANETIEKSDFIKLLNKAVKKKVSSKKPA